MLEEIGIIVIVAILFIFAYGVLAIVFQERAKTKPKPKEKVEPKKPKPVKPSSKPSIPNPCELFKQTGHGYVGYLRKEWKKAGENQPYPPPCYPACKDFLRCVGVEK